VITCDVLGYSPANSGLGNQMFCIATTLSLANDNFTDAIFPDLSQPHYEYYGNTIFHRLNKSGSKDFACYTFKEEPFTSTQYNKIMFLNGMKISGHFQSYKYFDDNRGLIINNFEVPDSIKLKLLGKYQHLINDTSLSIHVRRQDYLKFSGHYATLGEEYYLSALEQFDNISNIFVFSDDIDWCKENFDFIKDKEIIFVEGQSDVEDMWLMSQIKNNIIANSTFSWWAAYLNRNEDKKVVRPKEWFGPKRTNDNELETKDLFPKEWIKI
jgi:5'(3')-deoxyribonucleotidase